MKAKPVLIVIVLILLFTACTSDADGTSKDNDSASSIGNKMHDSVNALMSDNELHNIAEVDGICVSSEYFEVRSKLYEAAGSQSPDQDAWNEIKKEICEYNFASANGILPSESEIIDYTNEMRKVMESSEETIVIEETLCASMGLTVDQYWNDYRPKYETPIELTRANINAYIKESDEEISYVPNNITILDKKYFEEKRIH